MTIMNEITREMQRVCLAKNLRFKDRSGDRINFICDEFYFIQPPAGFEIVQVLNSYGKIIIQIR